MKHTIPKRKKHKTPSYQIPIIAGRFKGKRIEIPGTALTRSSKAILRESLFNTLQFNIVDKNFIEVFAGSGSIGLEALSRGAKHCIFMEKDPIAFEFLKSNIAKLDPNACTTLYGDSFEMFQSALNSIRNKEEKTYFYFDPPFSFREGMEDIYQKTLRLVETITPLECAGVIIEHQSDIALPENIGCLYRDKTRRFGKSALSYYFPHTE